MKHPNAMQQSWCAPGKTLLHPYPQLRGELGESLDILQGNQRLGECDGDQSRRRNQELPG